MRLLFVLILINGLSINGVADILHVPGDFTKIQEAIDAAAHGDTVLVAPGTYIENISFIGKAIWVKSSDGAKMTVIDGKDPVDPNVRCVVTFDNHESADSVLDGFTLTNGGGNNAEFSWSKRSTRLWGYFGGGILCYESSPTLVNNIIIDNWAEYGGGIACHKSNVMIIDNEIFDNSSYDWGGGILLNESEATITNNLIRGNESGGHAGGIMCRNRSSATISNNLIMDNLGPWSGGGIECQGFSDVKIYNNIIIENSSGKGGGINCSGASPDISNNLIAGNWGGEYGGGFYCTVNSTPTITNSIFWDNFAFEGVEIYVDNFLDPSVLTMTHSDVKGGLSSTYIATGSSLDWGDGMIDADPLFADFANKDFHLTFNSPCKDSGDNTAVVELYDFEGDPRMAHGTVDMGPDEFSNHLYCTGDNIPGGTIEGKLVGLPDTWPVGLFIGSGVSDPPLQHLWGDFYLDSPWQFFPLVPIPADGVLAISAVLPATPAPYDIYLQALIGWELSNLFMLEVR